ncbi:MAG: ABC transporter ATP-binding protein [Erysipelotrichaceae bacterium]|jgi:ATP-binding cassette subfamily B multidrug efflux pump
MNRLFKYIRPYWFLVLISLFLSLIVVVTTLYVPVIIGKCIDILAYQAVDFVKLKNLLTTLAITVCITVSSQWLQSLINNHTSYQICRDIRNEAFAKIHQLSLSYLDNHTVGEITNLIINDVDSFNDGLLMGFNTLFISLLTIIGTIIYMLNINVSITLIVCFLTPLSLLVSRYISSRTHSLFIQQSTLRSDINSYIDEMVSNQKVVDAFNQQNNSQKNLAEINDSYKSTSIKAIFFSSLTNPATRVVNATVYGAIATFGGLIVINNTITIGALSSFLSYASQYTKPFNEISGVIVELQNAIVCGNRVFDLINQQDEYDAVSILDQEVEGNISLDGVYFSYIKDRPFIEDLTVNIKKGEKVAIVGPTGCGKTTLINLIMNFYPIDSGSIKIEGVDYSTISKDSLRENFGMVLQDSWLKNVSIKENLLMAKEDATDEEIISVCKKCHVHNFIQRLPDGYDTIIKQNDSTISTGQKQLLCIARIMLKDPEILILDEATSNIDTRTEIRIQQAFDDLMQNKTSIIVAHRLSTIQNADIILVMKDGKIIERGKHQQLLSQKGFYHKLYNAQFEQ